MKISAVGGLCCALVGCSGVVGSELVECDDAAPLSAVKGSPVAAVGPAAPFSPEAVAVVFGPFPSGATIERVQLGGAPGWGCSVSAELDVAVWSSESPQPAGDPIARAAPVGVLETADIGQGFSSRTVALPEPVAVARGAFVIVSMTLERSDSCGARTNAPGRFWRWRDGAWTPVEAELVAALDGCE